ncbi:uncharacterized protein LOC129574137 [Sitodiplosis mosellana]|uniref:uncharacterized protein LOC129574137 n=1 Tax=Sitodiplosis mosellana TaxID=263140 RepID=UPI002444FE3E|nr:uncharacterized protein LOC129574137 [Sitodiplosis mosellana]
MVYLQVENCNQRFNRLEILKNNKWVDPDLCVIKEKKIRKTNSMISKNTISKKRVNSAVGVMLKEARKILRNETKENDVGRRTPMTQHGGTWIVEDCLTNYKIQDGNTPTRGILKTPGSVRRVPCPSLTWKTSPQVKLFIE